MLNKVVFPAPFGPISPTISPARTANDTRLTARSPPKSLETWSTVSSSAIVLAIRYRTYAVRVWERLRRSQNNTVREGCCPPNLSFGGRPRKSCQLALAPWLGWVGYLARRLVERPDQHLLAILPLVDDRRDLGRAIGVELHRPGHSHHVGGGDRIADLVVVE